MRERATGWTVWPCEARFSQDTKFVKKVDSLLMYYTTMKEGYCFSKSFRAVMYSDGCCAIDDVIHGI